MPTKVIESMQHIDLPEFSTISAVTQNLLDTIQLMKRSDDLAVREAAFGLEPAIRVSLPNSRVFAQAPLTIQTADGPFVSAIAYACGHDQGVGEAIVTVYAALAIGPYYFTLSEIGRELTLAKEWYTLEGLSVLARIKGFDSRTALSEANRIVGSKWFRLEVEAYGLAKVCRAYRHAEKVAVEAQGAHPDHPFLLQQYERLYEMPGFEDFHPNALRAIELALEYLVEAYGQENTVNSIDDIPEAIADVTSSWWHYYLGKVESTFLEQTHPQIIQSFDN
jgi:hypothetical protein